MAAAQPKSAQEDAELGSATHGITIEEKTEGAKLHGNDAIALLGARLEILMIGAWTKSGIDFVAPVVWSGFDLDTVGGLFLASGCFWLLGCFLWMVSVLRSVSMDKGLVLSWGIAGIFYVLTLQAPGPAGWSSIASWSTYLAGLSWLMAALSWGALAFRCIRVTPCREAIVIFWWAACGVFFMLACVEPSLSQPARWTWISSAAWWSIGVASWAYFWKRGGSFCAY
eukprot:TRINITY_DN25870_c0_g1_i1.p1 TRINITY_DN25870_c0_g1~~TRINITY_DN25870_c0_g1_i1.p1  ORF type:complete len:226 (+),score=25.05 TRINITY_DN25870_c0_g1_i1:69-746(+)